MDDIEQPKSLEECLELQSHFIGIPKITKKTKQEFYRRGKTLQILGVGFLDKGRMPTFEEVEAHIDLETTAERLDTKKWNHALVSILADMTNKIIIMEEEGQNKDGSSDSIASERSSWKSNSFSNLDKLADIENLSANLGREC